MSFVRARIATVDGRMLSVVAHPCHVGITDHPTGGHAGWTMHTADARLLAAELVAAADDIEGKTDGRRGVARSAAVMMSAPSRR